MSTNYVIFETNDIRMVYSKSIATGEIAGFCDCDKAGYVPVRTTRIIAKEGAWLLGKKFRHDASYDTYDNWMAKLRGL